MSAEDNVGQFIARNGERTRLSDPTELTDRAIAKSIAAQKDYIDGQLEVRDERLRGIDTTLAVRLTLIHDLAAEGSEKIAHLKELEEEKFTSIKTQFKERDTRAERESRDNKVAVDAAFAAQKEAAAKQDEANAKAIDKSEKATAETIKTNQELSGTRIEGLTKDVDGLKLSVIRIESTRLGSREGIGDIKTIFLAGLSILSGVLAAYAALKP